MKRIVALSSFEYDSCGPALFSLTTNYSIHKPSIEKLRNIKRKRINIDEIVKNLS